MIRLKFYTALFLLFIPAAICWLQRDLQKVLDDIHYRSRICDITNIAKRSQDRHLYMAEYISNFDGYLDFYQPVGKLRDVSEKYDCPLDPGTYDDCPTDYGYLEEYIE